MTAVKLKGAEILIECLKEQGVDTIFGFPGGSVLNIYDALYKHKEEIRHILTSHEQGASHAADGYARATGKVGVCIATSGPGATNLVTGIATAYMDSVPMVAITGNVAVSLLGKDSFQEVDITGITMPVTKHNYIVRDVNNLAEVIREAFYIAQSGRPGPVLIDIPKDVTANLAEYEKKEPRSINRCTEYITAESLEEAFHLIEQSKKPFIYAGGGVVKSEADNELVEFAEKINAPVTCSLMGQGGFPGTHEYYTGMIGMHGTKASNLGVTKCDLLIVVGARFSDRVVGKIERFAPNAQVLHMDVDPAEVNKNVQSHHFIIGDIKKVLKQLNKKIPQYDRAEWVGEIMELKNKYPLTYSNKGLKAQYIIEKLYELTQGDAVITTEVGQHQMWAAQYYKYTRPKTFISSGGLGTMGYGLGASIGVQIGCPDKQVINIAGDGSFRMNLNELATAVEYNLPIVVLLINNHALGMVRQWQTLFYDRRYSETTLDGSLNYMKLADAFGMKGYTIAHKEEVEDILKTALKEEGPVLVNCEIHSDDKVFPMVAPGAPIEEVMLEDL